MVFLKANKPVPILRKDVFANDSSNVSGPQAGPISLWEPAAGHPRINHQSSWEYPACLRPTRKDAMETAFSNRESLLPNGDRHVQEVVRAAHDELRQLIRQRAEIMKRIGTVKQTIAGLANLFGDGVLNDELLELVDRKTGGRQPGFTKACRMILMEANRALGAREVCEQIQQRVPTLLLRHKDPLASVTTVLNRLVEYGEARAVSRDNGRRAWQWVADAETEGRMDAADTPLTEI
jgi:hypothetical protein